MEKEKLTQFEINKIINEAINISIVSKLLKMNLITEKQYYVLREKIKKFL